MNDKLEYLKMHFSQAKYQIEKYNYDEYHLSFSLEEINIILEILETIIQQQLPVEDKSSTLPIGNGS